MDVAAVEVLIRQGEAGSQLYFVEFGQLSVAITQPGRKVRRLCFWFFVDLHVFVCHVSLSLSLSLAHSLGHSPAYVSLFASVLTVDASTQDPLVVDQKMVGSLMGEIAILHGIVFVFLLLLLCFLHHHHLLLLRLFLPLLVYTHACGTVCQLILFFIHGSSDPHTQVVSGPPP